MSDLVEEIVYRQYCPHGVRRIIGTGSSAFVGEVDESTVLKYPLAPGGDMSRLEIESKLFQAFDPHPHIIRYKGFSTSTGLYLERADNGTLADYILESRSPIPTIRQRLTWCLQAAEAVMHIHTYRILHCDIQPTNFLLDRDLHLKLSDFQGQHLSEEGDVLLEGGSSEPCRFFVPRDDPFSANVKTDLFALGCTLYFIMMGYAVFPDIVDGTDGWQEKVVDRFVNQQFPENPHACCKVTRKCWLQEYDSAQEAVEEIKAIMKQNGDG